MNESKLEKLNAKGRQLLEEGNIEEARKLYHKILEYEDNIYVRNNLALAYYLSGDYDGALSVLKPVISDASILGEPNPFSFAVASMIYSALENEFQAVSYLKRAVGLYDQQLLQFNSNKVPVSFLEYTIIIMRAAAKLNDHRKVYDLYRRWRDLHVSWEADYMAAVACFNMRDYKKAIKFWENAGTTFSLANCMSKIAMKVMQGEIPFFEMNYEIFSERELDEMFQKVTKNEEYRRQFKKKGFFKMMAIDMFLSNEEGFATNWLRELINLGGEWGNQLGKRILNSYHYSAKMKSVAAQVLTEKGVFSPGEPIPAVIEGRKTQIKIKTQEIIMNQNEKLDEIISKARYLKNEGKLDDAINLLEDLMQKEQFYPPAMMNLANYYRLKDEKEKSLELFEILGEVLKDEPIYLFNYSALLLDMGNVQKAQEYFERIKRPGYTQEFEEKLKLLEEMLYHERIIPDDIMEYFEESMRTDVEKKAIPIAPSLARGLKNMPSQWLDEVGKAFDLEPARRRRDR
ncbi:MAG: tetratricopeptide repeat protein, partial [Thermoanaerobacterales bacterium]|nr:tetratricopeptide repeat protein [Thermoanaerobacterales bacterium]